MRVFRYILEPERFRGSLDHIRAMICDNALAGANECRRYLMLYDTVPGGTGYWRA